MTSSSSTDKTFVCTRINRLVLRFILPLGYVRNGDEEPKSAAQVRERVHAHRCISENCSDLPDYDVHHQHVSNQSDHTHDGVESGDDDRYDDRVGVVFQPALRVASRLREARAVACVGQVLAEGAAVVVQQGQLATENRAVTCALHGFQPTPSARSRTALLWCPAGDVCRVRQGRRVKSP